MASYKKDTQQTKVGTDRLLPSTLALIKERYGKILLTGAAGGVGQALRGRLAQDGLDVRASDRAPMTPLVKGEEIVPCDLADLEMVEDLVRGCGGVIHLGGKSIEGTFEEILQSNIRGTYNLFEAVRRCMRKHGVRPRIFFASSNHVMGFYEQKTQVDHLDPMKPDSLYGVSKCFGENLGSYYWHKFGIENISVRIGACFEKPTNRRLMTMWLSYDDLTRLIYAIFSAPRVAHTVMYATSANESGWYDNRNAAFLGWQPQDTSRQFRQDIEEDEVTKTAAVDIDDPAVIYQGGGFAKAPHFEDPT
ncbi:MAG: NAD(P)-dependent oxidoreductase [Pseudomonadota bacterium]